jgi:hypothetical protein
MRALIRLCLCLTLAACAPDASGTAPDADPATGVNPITGDAISTSSLDATAEAATALPDLPDPAPAATVDASQNTAPVAAAVEPDAAADSAATTAAEAPPPEETATPEAAPDVPQAAKSDAQVRCERGGGKFVLLGSGNDLRACVKMTRDSGKRCDEKRDCQGQCLARSRTCSPVDPLFGCNEVLQNGGQAVTLCLN